MQAIAGKRPMEARFGATLAHIDLALEVDAFSHGSTRASTRTVRGTIGTTLLGVIDERR
ncbi:MAG TPA: hypothetical protein VK867_13685 [Candidatus Limnocylindrales bacterium]|nr:hypothetical protein [Candidatus Limnocylindrales bacterium]